MLECANLNYRTSAWQASYNLTLSAETWVGVAGPSGGGKSTLLSLLCGFLPAHSGVIAVGGRAIQGAAPAERPFSMMFQKSSLIPHLTCRQNLELVLRRNFPTRRESEARICEALRAAALEDEFLDRYPTSLSGGQLARMNLARTLVRPCEWLLLDEPFAAIDPELRAKILIGIENWRRKNKCGVILVSHEPADAMLMADELVYIEDGKVVAADAPEILAQNPKSARMARLLKTGTVFSWQNQECFVEASDILTDEPETNLSPYLTISIPKFRLVRHQTALHLMDLATGQVWTLPAHREFQGSIFILEERLRRLT